MRTGLSTRAILSWSWRAAQREGFRSRWTTQVWTVGRDQTVSTASGRPMSPSRTSIRTSFTPRFLISVRMCTQCSAPTPPPAHSPRMSRRPSVVTASATWIGRFATAPWGGWWRGAGHGVSSGPAARSYSARAVVSLGVTVWREASGDHCVQLSAGVIVTIVRNRCGATAGSSSGIAESAAAVRCQRSESSAGMSEGMSEAGGAGVATSNSAANTRGAAVWYPIHTSPPALPSRHATSRPTSAVSTQPLS